MQHVAIDTGHLVQALLEAAKVRLTMSEDQIVAGKAWLLLMISSAIFGSLRMPPVPLARWPSRIVHVPSALISDQRMANTAPLRWPVSSRTLLAVQRPGVVGGFPHLPDFGVVKDTVALRHLAPLHAFRERRHVGVVACGSPISNRPEYRQYLIGLRCTACVFDVV